MPAVVVAIEIELFVLLALVLLFAGLLLALVPPVDTAASMLATLSSGLSRLAPMASSSVTAWALARRLTFSGPSSSRWAYGVS